MKKYTKIELGVPRNDLFPELDMVDIKSFIIFLDYKYGCKRQITRETQDERFRVIDTYYK